MVQVTFSFQIPSFPIKSSFYDPHTIVENDLGRSNQLSPETAIARQALACTVNAYMTCNRLRVQNNQYRHVDSECATCNLVLEVARGVTRSTCVFYCVTWQWSGSVDPQLVSSLSLAGGRISRLRRRTKSFSELYEQVFSSLPHIWNPFIRPAYIILGSGIAKNSRSSHGVHSIQVFVMQYSQLCYQMQNLHSRTGTYRTILASTSSHRYPYAPTRTDL